LYDVVRAINDIVAGEEVHDLAPKLEFVATVLLALAFLAAEVATLSAHLDDDREGGKFEVDAGDPDAGQFVALLQLRRRESGVADDP
jgi:hypothetical protein